MGTIEYIRHDDEAALDILASAFARGSLVPVIGAGFTQGCPSKSRTVPSGTQFKLEMLEKIKEHNELDENQIAKLSKKTFSEIANYYFDINWVPRDIVIKHLEAAFKGVQLPPEKVSFINDIEWPYLYTLNVDDGIENCSNYERALPYNNNLSDRAKSLPTVFKLHGDIDYELRHEDTRLVFQKADYLQALTTNRKMLEFLKLDLINKNVVYIGCGLSDELDIAFIVAQQNRDLRRQTRNIIFLSERLDKIDEQEYAGLGINCIILIDKGRYEQIYDLLTRAYQHSALITSSLKEFKGSIRELPVDETENQDFLIRGVVELNSGTKKYSKVLPYYYSPRKAEVTIERSLKNNEITVIAGPRVSGRTLTAYSILNRIRDRTIYIIESTVRVDSRAINQLLGQKNAIIFFDSLTLSRDELWNISRLRKKLLSNNSRVLICSEAHSRDIEQILQQPGEKTGVITLGDMLHKDELEVLNNRAITTRLPTFTTGKYILDKVYRVFTIIGENTLISKITQSPDLFKILYVLAVNNQFTGQEIHFAGLEFTSVENIVKSNSPYLQFEDISANERVDHTSYKIVTHASSWVVSVLREILRVKGVTWCADTLMGLFTQSYETNKSFVIELRKFDNINFVFGAGQQGAAAFIINLYDRLESIEGTEPEFYVQKAKAYYNMYDGADLNQVLSARVRELEKALTWAKTAHLTTTIRNIVHAKALTCLRRAVDKTTPNETDIVEAIEALVEAIGAEGNSVYLRNFLEGKIRGSDYLTIFLRRLNTGSSKFPILLTMKGKIADLEAKITFVRESAGGK